MKLKPHVPFNPEEFSELYEGTVIETAAQEILTESGINEPSIVRDSPNEYLKAVLNKKGGSLERVADNVINIMCRGETEASRMRAAEFIAKIQGIQVELDDKPAPKEITINIIGQENAPNLINFMMPR